MTSPTYIIMQGEFALQPYLIECHPTMSEYWVSKKKYYCKYCEIYITDDAPSRQQHENGMRHKGNVERFIRGIYKTGEKQKKDREEEVREMKRVEQVRHFHNSSA